MSVINQYTSASLKEIEQDKLPVLEENDALLKLFPTVSEDTDELHWEQEDNYVGVQNARGVNGQPGMVSPVGAKHWKAEVGYYGDGDEITEDQITRARKLGTFGETQTINGLLGKRQDRLLQREVDRKRLMVSTLLTTGAYTAFSPSGALIHTDTYAFQTAAAAVAWVNLATARPLFDFRELKKKARGRSVRFDKSATAYMNLTTVNYLLGNTNAADLYGKRMDVGGTFNSLDDINKVFAANDLPQIEVYDETYFTDAAPTVPVLFIPDNSVVVVGKRSNGSSIGDICQTRNANNTDCAPGSYTLVTDSLNSTMNPVPRRIRIDRGWNGGMRIYHPSAVIRFAA